MNIILKIPIYVLIFVLLFNNRNCFDVKFQAIYNAEIESLNTQIYKRELTQFFDKSSFSFNGFKKVESIPVLFPIDICILNLEGIKYATSLHRNRNGVRHFAIFKMNNGSYSILADIEMPKAIAMDCKGIGPKGYIAIAFNFSTPVENAREGSPIYELFNDHLKPIQFFASANLVKVYLRVQGNDIMLLQTFKNTKSTPNVNCPYFKWSGSTFNRMGHIPCSNARHLEPFSIDYEHYVAVANYADQRGRTATYSEIYKFMKEKKRFQLFQKIKTNGAVDVRYFNVPIDEVRRQHFLIFGNSLGSKNSLSDGKAESKNLEADSVFYIYEKGQFVPYQKLTFYAVKQFLPIQNVDAEKFLLLVASTNQDIKIYNLNDWKFEESKAQFTEGALSKGVARMRIFQERDESFLVIANELMADNETNVFLPIFKQEEHANALRQQIIDWAKTNLERLKRIDVEKLKSDVEQKIIKSKQRPTFSSSQKFTDIAEAKIENVITSTLNYPPLHLSSNYWKALIYAHRALNALEAQYEPRRPQKREVQVDQLPESTFDFEHLDVKTLVVHDKFQAEQINGIKVKQLQFESINSKQVIVTGRYSGPPENERNNESNEKIDKEDVADVEETTSLLNVQNLIVEGKLNGIFWPELLNNSLKRKGDLQFMKAPASIKNLKTDTFTVTSDEVSGMNLGKLVPINGGNFVVSQDVQFDAPVKAKEVTINERLNQIHILQKRLDVLLKKSNETQIVTGPKRLNTLRVLEPITLAGSPAGNHLRAITPNKAIHENLMLQGDFFIDGNVTIKKFLEAKDLWDVRSNTSAKNTFSNGLRVDKPLDNVNIFFEKPIIANSSDVSFINKQDMQQLLHSNSDFLQLVDGLKTFKGDLTIAKGFSEVQILNGIDIESLEKSLLLKEANQTISAPMHINRVVAKGIKASNSTLNNHELKFFLTKHGDQHINGSLVVENLITDTLEAADLNINGKIFQYQLADIYQQKGKLKQNNKKLFQNEEKFNGTIYVKNLRINGSLNDKPLRELERLLIQLDGNIKYVGNYKVNYDMNITNLTFHGELNGIKAEDFGNCWLQKTGEQIFTEPQTFDSAEFKKGAFLAGKLNGYTINDFLDKFYWINGNEFITEAIFQNPIELKKKLYTNTLNNLQLPNDFLYHNSKEPQIVDTLLSIEKNLRVMGNIANLSTINELNLKLLQDYLQNSQKDGTLYVEQAYFDYEPFYNTLNKHNLQKTLDTIWLANENIEITNHVEMSEAYFEGLLELEGYINNVNLRLLKENYLSRSRPQVITTPTNINNMVTFESDIRVDEINLHGALIEPSSNSTIYFDEFVSNSLKKNGPHEVRSNWTLLQARIAGGIQNITVNNLNLVTDILRSDIDINYIIAPKYINKGYIPKLYASKQSFVNNVPVSEWMENSAYIHGNQTIYGVATLTNANFEDLKVIGRVNDQVFNEENLWLQDQEQTVHGRVKLRNKFPKEQRILVNNIENLETKEINGMEVENFFQQMSTHPVDFILERNVEMETNDYDEDAKDNLFKLESIIQKWEHEEKARDFIFSGFKQLQFLPVTAMKLIPLTLRLSDDLLDVLIVSSGDEPVKFYRWSNEILSFLPYNKELSWLPQDLSVLEVINLICGSGDYLLIQRAEDKETFQENIVSSEGFKEVLNLKKRRNFLIEPLQFNQQDCFVIYTNDENMTSPMEVFCLDSSVESPLLKLHLAHEIKRSAKHILKISNEKIAVLVKDCVEIWNATDNFKLIQRIKLPHEGKRMTVGQLNDITYLAVTIGRKMNSVLEQTIEIYSTSSSDFTHEQSIYCGLELQQIELVCLNKSRDLLLNIITSSMEQPLVVYQFKGLMGFQKIFSLSTLNTASQMKYIKLKAAGRDIVALFQENGIAFVEIVFKSL